MSVSSISKLNSGNVTADENADYTSESRLAKNYRESVTLDGATDASISERVFYPRIKKMSNGQYILFEHDNRVSGTVFYALSADGLHFTPRQPLWSAYAETRPDGVADRVMYCNLDGIVLKNGDILAFCSYRYNKGYSISAEYSGIVMRRSRDNGVTWSEDVEIYRGRNWEAMPIQLPSGEIQLYFSHTAPKFYLDPTVRTDSSISTSSGSAIIRSYDNGLTWTPNVTGAPYSAWIVSQNYVETMANGTKIFTNQMPSAVALNNGNIAVITESNVLGETSFMLTVAHSDDNWQTPIGIDEDGPADKEAHFTYGAGPYILQFPSGETLISYNTGNNFHLRIGNADARNFNTEQEVMPFGNAVGYWGSISLDTTHSIIAAFPNILGGGVENDLLISKYYLNHRISAKPVVTDGTPDSNAWENNTDALFIGGASQAQAAIRAGYDEENIYFFVDRLDYMLTNNDSIELSVYDGNDVYSVKAQLGGVYTTAKNGSAANFGGNGRITLCGQIGVRGGENNGALTLVTIPRTAVAATEFKLFATLENIDEDGVVTTESFENVSSSDTSKWFTVTLD